MSTGQDLYRALFESVSDAVLLMDQGSFAECNASAATLFGGTKEDIVGRSLAELSPAAQLDGRDSAQAFAERVAVALSGEPQCFEWLCQRRDDEMFYAQVTMQRFRSDDEVWLSVSVHDVTEQKQVQQELQAEKMLMGALMDNTVDSIYFKDRQARLTRANRKMLRDVGLDKTSQIVGKTDVDLFGDEFGRQTLVDDLRVIETGEAIDGLVESREVEDGQTHWWSTTKVPVRDDDDQIVGLVGITREITAMVRAEQALRDDAVRESEARLALALEAADAGVWELRTQTGQAYFGPRWFTMLGYEPDELPHTYETWASLLYPDEAYDVQLEVQRHIRNGEDFAIDVRMRTKDKGWRWVHAIGKSIETDENGRTTRLIGTHTDITEQVEAARVREELYRRRAEQVRASAEISQELAAVPALDELFRRVVTLIKERFGYHHVQLFRYEPAVGMVVLVYGYGEVGERMLAEGHRIPMGRGVVGKAAATGEPVLASDVTRSRDWFPNPHLPDTRGELAAPIVFRDRVLGILDVQSEVVGALDEDDQLLLESICGSIALAIEDTNLRQEMEARLRELNALQRIMTRQEWDAFRTQTNLVDGYVYDQRSAYPVTLDTLREATQEQVGQDDQSPSATARRSVTVPMDVGGETVGILGVQEDADHPLSAQERELLSGVSRQVAAALQRARLLEQTQSRARRERVIRDIADRMQRAVDVESLVRVTAEELTRALGASHAYVRMGAEDELSSE
jgi:PAS domain S-box-containing protein